MHQRTPCVGICSTTYGDLVCRGCKRFAHEIVGWNGYSPVQQQEIERRLSGLRRGAALVWVSVVQPDTTRAVAERLGVAVPADDVEAALWELLRRSVRHRLRLEDLGLALVAEVPLHKFVTDSDSGTDPAPADWLADDLRSLVNLIDREFYLRSIAFYERSYRVPAL